MGWCLQRCTNGRRTLMSNKEGRYIYGITAATHKQELGPIGIGGRGDIVYIKWFSNIITCSVSQGLYCIFNIAMPADD